jgi:hypothetical protein
MSSSIVRFGAIAELLHGATGYAADGAVANGYWGKDSTYA